MDTSLDGIAGYVTPRQAAKVFSVTPNAIIQRIRRARIPVYRVSGRWLLVKLDDIEASYGRDVRRREGDA